MAFEITGRIDGTEQDTFQISGAAVRAAASYEVTTGSWKGQTVLQVAESGDDGRKWLVWVMRNEGRVRRDLFAAVATYMQARLPDYIDVESAQPGEGSRAPFGTHTRR